MKICIFCSANQQIDPDFFELTRVMGLRLGAAGHTLVYGGCNLGLMGCLARAWKDAGGHTVGVIPRSFTHDGKLCDFLDEVHYTQNLSDRKDLMLSLADAVVALPGGIGRHYSATLLTAVLQAVQRIVGILCSVLHTVNAKHSAFVM